MFHKLIHTSFSPNVTRRDVGIVFRILMDIPKWVSPHAYAESRLTELHDAFQKMFRASFAVSFDSGRSALAAVLSSCGFRNGDRVVLQAFTCAVVPNAIIAAGLTPVYVDIDDTYNIDVKKLRNIIETTPTVRAVIVQHTFGQPADIEEIVSLCHASGIRVIEDCAHALGARVGKRLVGTFGDAAMFSFGRDKVISTVSGGVAITNDEIIGNALRASYSTLPFPTRRWILQRLFHPLLFVVAKRVYYFFNCGKVIIAIARRLRLFPEVLTPNEKQGQHPPILRYPPLLVPWALHQLRQQEIMNNHRRAIALRYHEALKALASTAGWIFPSVSPGTTPIFLRYAVQVPQRQELLTAGKRRGILFGDWYCNVITPVIEQSRVYYTSGSCPAAERVTHDVINLPLTPTMTICDVDDVIDFCKIFFHV